MCTLRPAHKHLEPTFHQRFFPTACVWLLLFTRGHKFMADGRFRKSLSTDTVGTFVLIIESLCSFCCLLHPSFTPAAIETALLWIQMQAASYKHAETQDLRKNSALGGSSVKTCLNIIRTISLYCQSLVLTLMIVVAFINHWWHYSQSHQDSWWGHLLRV